MQLNFGVGTFIGKRTDITNAKPSFLGVLQDCEIDMDQALKELTGQYKMPVDVAPGALKVTGKAKFARIQGATVNNLLLGQTETDNAGIDMAIAESFLPATGTYQVTNHSTFVEDLGVFYAGTGTLIAPAQAGQQLQPVASSPATGQYSVNPGTGTYTFSTGDEPNQMLAYYSYTVANLVQLSLANQQMGLGPVFEINLKQDYFVQGVEKKLILKLNACRASKWTLPFKNTDYTIQDFEFTAFADPFGNWGTYSFSE